jgi:type VI secretion system secreted protein VgrG
VAKNLRIEAGDSIELVVGSAKLIMKKDGSIILSGHDITINGSGTVNVKSSKIWR